jgi:ankyrin repeat protein
MIILMIFLFDDTQDGWTALHYAVIYGRYDCAQLLIQSGADVDIKNTVSTLYVHTVYHHDHTQDISYW